MAGLHVDDPRRGGRNRRIGYAPGDWHFVPGHKVEQTIGHPLKRTLLGQADTRHVIFKVDRDRQGSARQASAHA